MRIVVCFYFRPNAIPLGQDIASALEAQGHAVFRFDSSPRDTWMRAKRLAKSFAKLFGAKERLSRYFERLQARRLAQDFVLHCRSSRPELILLIRGESIDDAALQQVVAESGARTIAWWVKNPRWQAGFRDEARRYDAAFSIDASFCGAGIGFLPCWAINRIAFFPIPFESKRRSLLFVGTWSPRRQRFLEAVANLPLQIIGPDWRKRLPASSMLRRCVVADRVAQAVMAEWYRSVWAVIDVRQIDQGTEQGVNMRFADVPASGTVLLTEPSAEVEQWRLEGRCALLFSSPEELRRQAEFLLSNEKASRAMSAGALDVAETMPTFAARAAQILDAIRDSASEGAASGA